MIVEHSFQVDEESRLNSWTLPLVAGEKKLEKVNDESWDERSAVELENWTFEIVVANSAHLRGEEKWNRYHRVLQLPPVQMANQQNHFCPSAKDF